MKESLLVVGSCIVAFLLGFQLVFPLLIKQEDIAIEGVDENIVNNPKVLGDPPIDWNWVIENDTVFINNSWAYLSATPHTLVDDGWVEFELESKILSGDIDAIWGFDSSEARPSNPEIWLNYTHNMTGQRWVEQYFNNTFWVLAGVNLGLENYDLYDVDFGNKNNTYLWNLSCISYDELDGWYNYSIIIAFESKTPIGQAPNVNYTFFYYDEDWETYYYDSTFFDWKDFERDITVVNHEWDGFNKWYMVDAAINVDHRYKVRCWVDIPFGGLDGSSGKYVWAIKEHSKTMQEAISSGHLIYLDPWWNSSWDHYKTITLDSSKVDTDLINFPVLVVFDNTTFNIDNSKSIRFTAGSNSGGTDNVTEYAYEIEEWDDAGDCFVWVNVTRVYSASDTVFNMYYNNSAASDNQNPTGVWDSYYMAVWHMNNLTDSTSNDIDLTNTGADSGATGKIGNCYLWVEANGDYMYHDTFWDTFPSAVTAEIWFNMASDNCGDLISKRQNDVANRIMLFSGNSIADNVITCRAGGGANDPIIIQNGFVSTATWYYNAYTYADNDVVTLWDNDSEQTSANPTGTMADGTGFDFRIGARSDSVASLKFDGRIDEVRSSNVIRNDSWIKATFHSQNQTTDFLTFGAEQSAPAGVNWQSTFHWNVSFKNSSVNKSIMHWNVSFRNSSSSSYMFVIRPKNESTGQRTLTECEFWANDTQGNALTTWIEENTTGPGMWIMRQKNLTVAPNSTVNWTHLQATNNNTRYWWRVTINNTITNITEVFWYKTANIVTQLNLEDLSLYDNITWSGHVDDGSERLWHNSSGYRFETIVLNLTVNTSMKVTDIELYADELTNGVVDLSASRMTVYVSVDNVTYDVLEDDQHGLGFGVLPPLGGSLVWNASTSPAPQNPFSYYGNGSAITNNFIGYMRIRFNTSDGDSAGHYINKTAWSIYIYNTSGGSFTTIDGDFFSSRLNLNRSSLQWNVSFRNTLIWDVNNWHWNVSFQNTSVNKSLMHWNLSFSNSSVAINQSVFHWNVSFKNISLNQTTFHWNVSFRNSSTTGWIIPQIHWNVSFQNHSNQPPVINFTSPANNSVDISVNIHWFNFTVYDNNSDQMWCNATLVVEGCAQRYDSPAAFGNGTVSMLLGPACLPLAPGTTYSWWVNVTDDYTWTNETYYFTTEGLRVWNTTFHWNVSFKNSSDWFVNSWHWNMSFRNTSVNVTLFHWNVSFRNSALINTSAFHWNISFKNLSVNKSIFHWNTSFRNSTLNLTNYTIFHWNVSFRNSSISLIDIYDEFPTNRSTDIPRYIHLQVFIDHSLNYVTNITWIWGLNDSCTETIGHSYNTTDGRHTMIFTNASAYNTTYWWGVNASDGVGNYVIEKYWFNTSVNVTGGGGYGYILAGASIVGVVGILGLLGYFKRRKDRND